MEKIKIKFEYKCFPVWLYDESDNFIENDLPSILVGDIDIDSIFVKLQNEFDSLFKDDGIKFKYIGFNHAISKNEFSKKLDDAIELLQKKVGEKYTIENCLNIETL
jgi:hypothetical protein